MSREREYGDIPVLPHKRQTDIAGAKATLIFVESVG